MFLKSATILIPLFICSISTQNIEGNEGSPSNFQDLKNSPFFEKFFTEFVKQYEDLQKEKVTDSPIFEQPHPQHQPQNPFLNAAAPEVHTRRPSIKHRVNNISPKRRPRPNLSLFTTTPTPTPAPTTFAPRNSFVGLGGEQTPSFQKQTKRIGHHHRQHQEPTVNNDRNTDEGFLNFVQNALATNPSTSTTPAPEVVKKLVQIIPRYQDAGKRVARPKSDSSDAEDVFRKQAENAHYTFSSNVEDEINGNVHQRHEVREGNSVKGMYTYEDGFYRRTVHYEADDKGFRIVKEDVQEIGDGPQYNPDGSALIQSNVAGNTVNYQITNRDIVKKKNKVRFQAVEQPELYYDQYDDNGSTSK